MSKKLIYWLALTALVAGGSFVLANTYDSNGRLLISCKNADGTKCGGAGGTGTVTSVATGSGLTGGTITTTGTLNLANVAATTHQWFDSVVSNQLHKSQPAFSDISGTALVTQGGTGVATLGANGVMLGQGTAAIHVTGAGTAGDVLTSNGAGLDPTFQAAGGGGLPGGGITGQVLNAVTASPPVWGSVVIGPDTTAPSGGNGTDVTIQSGAASVDNTGTDGIIHLKAGCNNDCLGIILSDAANDIYAKSIGGATAIATSNNSGVAITLAGGSGDGTGSGGSASVIAGDGGTTGFGGELFLSSGAAGTGRNGGPVIIQSRDGGGGDSNGGNVSITAGNGSGIGPGGTQTITAGNGGATGDGGLIWVQGGQGGATSGNGSQINITSGSAQAGNSNGGTISVTAGNGSGTGAGGSQNFTAGSSAAGGGGSLSLTAGSGDTSGGSITLTSGAAGATGVGGPITVISGAGGDGIGGTIQLIGGAGSGAHDGAAVGIFAGASGGGATGNGGAVNLTAGQAVSTDGNGGDVVLTSGTGVGTGTDGSVRISSVTTGQIVETAIGGILLQGGGTLGTPTSCGVGPALGASALDMRGSITPGTGGPTACTLPFSHTYANPPVCVATNIGAIPAAISVSIVSTSAVTFALGLAGTPFNYICLPI